MQDSVRRCRQLLDERVAKTKLKGLASAKLARRSLKITLNFINSQIAEFDEAIAKIVWNDYDWLRKAELLKSVPGVGEVIYANLLAEPPELYKLKREQIAALASLSPCNHDSVKLNGMRSIRGDGADVRQTLYMADLTAAPPQSDDSRVLRTSETIGQALQSRAHGLHAQTSSDPQYDAERKRRLALSRNNFNLKIT